MSIKRATYLFRAGRHARLEDIGEAPTEFLYGYPQLKAAGWQVDLLEDADIGMAPPLAPLAGLVNKAARFLGNLPIGMAVPLFQRRTRARLPQAGAIVATTNGMGLALGIGRLLGLVRVPVILLAMGLVPTSAGRWARLVFGSITRQLELVAISRSEQAFLQRLWPSRPVRYLPFGVDQRFWYPAPREAPEDGYALAIGNDANRDWTTLVAAWSPDLPPLKIVTALPVPAGPGNVEVIRGDWRTSILTDAAIRALYRRASVVLVPVRQTIQPAGQSSCLQAMACGKAVIMTANDGLWDREIMMDGENVVLVPPSDPTALAAAVRRLAEEPDLRAALGRNARTTVEEHFNTDRMAAALAAIIEGLNAGNS